MSAPPRRPLTSNGIRPSSDPRLLILPAALAVVTVLAQIAYPLAPDRWLTRLSVVTVVAFALASVTHAVLHRGLSWAGRLVVIIVAGSLAAEVVGVASGLPFGRYSYTRTLGPEVAGVPLLVPLAWLMMGYPCLLMARVLATRTAARGRGRLLLVAALGGGALAGWDVFLDPQMVAAGHWAWAHPSPGLPGVATVPLTNLAGWLVVGAVLIAACDAALPRSADRAPRSDPGSVPDGQGVPAALLAWTWLGSALGNAAFFGRPWVALWGLLLLGVFVAPYLLIVLRPRRSR